MNEKKFIVELASSQQLPFVNSKCARQRYIRKSSVLKKAKSQTYESQQIKQEYLKIYKQIQVIYGISLEKSKPNFKKLNHSKVGRQKQVSIGKISKERTVVPITDNLSKITTQPCQSSIKQESKSHKNLDEDRESYNLLRERLQPLIDVVLNAKPKNKKAIQSFLLQRFEQDYFNFEKIRIKGEKAMRHKSDRNEEAEGSNNLSRKLLKLQIDKEEVQIFDRKSDLLPIITSISRKNEVKNEVRNDIKFLNNSNPETIQGGQQQGQAKQSKKYQIKKSTSLNRQKNFSAPFETYYYRDMIWKINFSNQTIIETPIEYDHRLRVFIGKGNNGGLIRGLIKRRIWFAVTEKIEDSNFAWTQIKYLPYFSLQKFKANSQINKKDDKILQSGLLTQKQSRTVEAYLWKNHSIEQRSDERLQHRNKHFIKTGCKNIVKQSNEAIQNLQKGEDQEKNVRNDYSITTVLRSVAQIKQQKMHNHLINNYVIGNKKALFKLMSGYYNKRDDYVFNYLPFTFHIEKGLQDQNYFKFLKFYYQRNKESKAITGNEDKCPWIVKPGQYSNRGQGIKVCKTLQQIKAILKTKEKYFDGTERTYIVQAYIQRPLLYNKRKFDLRHYMMITCVNGIIKGYWYQQGYVRTSSSQYTLQSNDGRIHLTNDAIQKTMPQYGKYEKGNKISYQQLHSYLQRLYGFKNFNFRDIILPKMKKITTDVIRACSGSIDPDIHANNFEIFGLDFMIDDQFNLWLIEVNTNPCLELSCPLLAGIIPKMIENALELNLDCFYPPPVRYAPKGTHYLKKLQLQNKFDLVYDSRIDGLYCQQTCALDARLLNEEEETYEDEGQQWNADD